MLNHKPVQEGTGICVLPVTCPVKFAFVNQAGDKVANLHKLFKRCKQFLCAKAAQIQALVKKKNLSQDTEIQSVCINIFICTFERF
jgi:hypothetical protein